MQPALVLLSRFVNIFGMNGQYCADFLIYICCSSQLQNHLIGCQIYLFYTMF